MLAQHSLGVVILSVCLSVIRMLCDKTKERIAHILIPHGTVTLVLGDVPFQLNFTFEVTHPLTSTECRL